MKNLIKNRIAPAAAALAVAAAVLAGALPAARAFAADGAFKVFTATAEITATYDKDGNIAVPDTELANGADFAVRLKSAKVESDHAFVSAWTNDAAGKVIEPGGKISVKWKAGSKLPGDWAKKEKVRVGTVTYTYERVTSDISGAKIEAADLVYDGEELTPDVTVKLDGKKLKAGTDYTVAYERGGKETDDLTSAGKVTVVITGKGDYAGIVEGGFAIAPKQLTDEELENIGLDLPEGGCTYDGAAKKPAVTGLPEGLKEGTDYDVAYSGNVNAGTAEATVTFKGNYAGEKELAFTIAPRQLTDDELMNIGLDVPEDGYIYDETAKEPAVTGVPKGLKEGTDYDVAYSGNVNAGTAKATVTFKGNYAGEKTVEFDIAKASISGAKTEVADLTYNGSGQTPSITVALGGKELDAGTDYTFIYKRDDKETDDLTNAGTVTVEVTGKGNYTGTATGSFTIKPKALTKDELDAIGLDAPADGYTYDGSAKKPAVKDVPSGLTEGTDYDVAYSGNVNAGTAEATITFKGNYAGEKTVEFDIAKVSVSGAKVEVADLTYNGKEQTPSATVTLGGKELEAGTDYTVAYERGGKETDDLTSAGELTAVVTGKGNYAGTVTGSFTIARKQLTEAELKNIGLDLPEGGCTYDGAAKKPALTGVPEGLTEGTDYDVAYSGNVNAGTAKATVTFKGNCAGSKVIEFDIAKKAVGVSWDDAIYTYDASAKAPIATVMGAANGESLTAALSYKKGETALSGAPSDAGSYTVIVTGLVAGEKTDAGNYALPASGLSKEFAIAPKQISEAELKAIGLDVPEDGYTYDGASKEPAVTGVPAGLTEGTDYEVAYEGNTDAGTAKATVTFKGNYEGEKELTFQIAKADILGASVTASTTEYDYTGSSIAPTITVTLGGKTLVAGTDYELTGDASATDIGSYSVGAAGKGNYAGITTTKVTWTIREANGYWLALAGATDPTADVLKTTAQIAADVAKIKANDASVIAEYTNYMNGKSADGSKDQEVRLYTDWNGGDADDSADRWVEFRIIQVGEHDDDGSGLTFMATHSLPTAKKMNSKSINDGGWGNSAMRTDVFGEGGYVQTGLSGLASAAKTVNKKAVLDSNPSSDGYPTWPLGTTADKFWLLSFTELYGDDFGSSFKYVTNATWITESVQSKTPQYFRSEGSQYDWCKARISTSDQSALQRMNYTRASGIPVGDSYRRWWLRSATVNTTSAFCGVYYNGAPVPREYASFSNCVVPAFCM